MVIVIIIALTTVHTEGRIAAIESYTLAKVNCNYERCRDDFIRKFKSSKYCKRVEKCHATAKHLSVIQCPSICGSTVKLTLCGEVNQCMNTESKDLCCYFFSCGDVCQ